MANINTSLEQHILDIPQVKRIADILIITKRIISVEELK